MFDFKLNNDDDIDFNDDDLVLVEGTEEILQSISNILKMRGSEFYFDKEVGLNTMFLFGKDFDANSASNAFAEACEQDNRVETVTNVLISKINRNLNVSIELKLKGNDNIQNLEVNFDD